MRTGCRAVPCTDASLACSLDGEPCGAASRASRCGHLRSAQLGPVISSLWLAARPVQPRGGGRSETAGDGPGDGPGDGAEGDTGLTGRPGVRPPPAPTPCNRAHRAGLSEKARLTTVNRCRCRCGAGGGGCAEAGVEAGRRLSRGQTGAGSDLPSHVPGESRSVRAALGRPPQTGPCAAPFPLLYA